MKRLFLLPALAAMVLLLSACPDNTKLPTPAPKVPEPKVAAAMLYSPPGVVSPGLDLGKAPASRSS